MIDIIRGLSRWATPSLEGVVHRDVTENSKAIAGTWMHVDHMFELCSGFV